MNTQVGSCPRRRATASRAGAASRRAAHPMANHNPEPLTDLLAEARGGVRGVPLVAVVVSRSVVWMAVSRPSESPVYITLPVAQWGPLVASVDAQLPAQQSALPEFAGAGVPNA